MKFLKSAFIISFCTFISKIFGLVRDTLMAKHLGASYVTDALVLAFKLPNTFRAIFAEGAFSASFIPIFSSEVTKNTKDKLVFFGRNIFSSLLYIVLIITILVEIFTPFVIKSIAPGFELHPDKFRYAVIFTRIIFPYLIFISMTSMMSAILNSYNKFLVTSIFPVILNLTLISSLLIAGYFYKDAAYFMSYGFVLGGVLQFLWIFYFTKKEGFLLFPIYPKLTERTKSFFSKFASAIVSSGLMQLNGLIDTVISASIPSAVSYLYYTNRVIQTPASLIGVAIGTSILPLLSKFIANGNRDEGEKIIQDGIFLVLFLSLPTVAFIILKAQLIISVLFEYGEFSFSDTSVVANLLIISAFSVVFFVINKVLQNIFFAHKDTKTPTIISLVIIITNIGLSLLLKAKYSYYGISFASTIALFFATQTMIFILMKRRMFSINRDFLINIFKIIIAIILSILTSILLNKFFNNLGINKIIILFVNASIFYGSYILSSMLFRIFLLKDIIKFIKKD